MIHKGKNDNKWGKQIEGPNKQRNEAVNKIHKAMQVNPGEEHTLYFWRRLWKWKKRGHVEGGINRYNINHGDYSFAASVVILVLVQVRMLFILDEEAELWHLNN